MKKSALLDWVDDQVHIPGGDKHVLEKLARYADANGCAWAKVEQLAKETNVSVRTVQYRLRALEAAGMIAPSGRFYRLGTRSVPIFQIAPDEHRGEHPETTVEAAGKGEAMGAKAAPMEAGDGCTGLHPYGCNCLHPHKEPKRTQLSEADASERRARAAEAAMWAGYDEALATYPDSGRGVTSDPESRAQWPAACAEAGGVAVLVATIAAYGADPSLKRRDFGAPSLQRFLREKRWKNWLPKVSSVANAVRVEAVWQGPPGVEVVLVARGCGDLADKYLTQASWNGVAVVARTRFAAGELRRGLRGTEFEVLDPPVGASVGGQG